MQHAPYLQSPQGIYDGAGSTLGATTPEGELEALNLRLNAANGSLAVNLERAVNVVRRVMGEFPPPEPEVDQRPDCDTDLGRLRSAIAQYEVLNRRLGQALDALSRL